MDEETHEQYLDYVYQRELEEIEEALEGIRADLQNICCWECRNIQAPALRAERKALRKRRERLMKRL